MASKAKRILLCWRFSLFTGQKEQTALRRLLTSEYHLSEQPSHSKAVTIQDIAFGYSSRTATDLHRLPLHRADINFSAEVPPHFAPKQTGHRTAREG